jgi:tetrahedral aminopeptidase
MSQANLITPELLALLEKLCNACAVSGDEGEVRSLVLDEIKPFADEVKEDALGNLLAIRHAKTKNPLRVMLDAHMDEVGFMLIDSEGEGLFRFEKVGGIDARQLVGKPVLVGREHVPGIIGARPIHLTTADERSRAMPMDSLRIDVGPGGNGKVKVGDRATFATRFQQVGPSLLSKALDDRLGVATLVELIKNPPENIELLAAFSVQEEIGLRGARVAAYALNPDLAIAIDSTPAFDLPMWDGSENAMYNSKLGGGPAIYTADAGTLGDPRLIRWLAQSGEELGIPYQFRQPGGGGTDAGSIHRVRAGVPSVSISVPGRYAHTAVLLSRLSDWEATLQLLHSALERLTPALLAGDRK